MMKHIIETDSRTSLTSALVLFVKNKMIVEFSDKGGALYVYNHGHEMVRQVTNRRHINNVADLKTTSMNRLIEIDAWGYRTNHEEGRMAHIGYWQDRLNSWMHEMVLSPDNTALSFQDSKDNDMFMAKPIPKEKYSLKAGASMENTKR